MNVKNIILFIFLLCLTNCAGCSKSGRDSIRRGTSENRVRERVPLEREKKRDLDNIIPKKESNGDIRIQDNKVYQLSELYEKLRKSVFVVYASNQMNEKGSQGSGFFLSEGVGVTNDHVLDSYDRYSIKTYDGKIYPVVEIIRRSPASQLDFAIFRIKNSGEHYPAAKVASYPPLVGEDVFAIGNPKGLEYTLSKGIISAYRPKINRIQTTAEITFGSSGGPLFNMQGEVVGITTSTYSEANLNFAVDIRELRLYP